MSLQLTETAAQKIKKVIAEQKIAENVAAGKVLGPPAGSDVTRFIATVAGSDVLIKLA